jgi:proton-translocating NADH-quinone oxidoreductase chain M
MFPLHTWLPDAHGEANAPVSMLLAGVLLKMGGYALLRFNVQMLPEAHGQLAPALIVLGIVNIVYGALNAFAQDNVKRRIACSSVSHMGFVLLGIGAVDSLGLSGAMLQMISHGLIAAAMFFVTGVFYERTKTLSIPNMGGLAKVLPITFAFFLASSLASLALPGMSGFVSEITVFLGVTSNNAFTVPFRVIAVVLAAIGLVLTPMYLLSLCRRVFLAPHPGLGRGGRHEASGTGDRPLPAGAHPHDRLLAPGGDRLLRGQHLGPGQQFGQPQPGGPGPASRPWLNRAAAGDQVEIGAVRAPGDDQPFQRRDRPPAGG